MHNYFGVAGIHALFYDLKAATAATTSAGRAHGGGYETRWPDFWEFVDSPANERVPREGLIEVSPTSDEYWHVHAQLRAPTECGWGTMDDAWLSKLGRVQNPQLYSFFDHWAGRLESVARDTMSAHMLATTKSGESISTFSHRIVMASSWELKCRD